MKAVFYVKQGIEVLQRGILISATIRRWTIWLVLRHKGGPGGERTMYCARCSSRDPDLQRPPTCQWRMGQSG